MPGPGSPAARVRARPSVGCGLEGASAAHWTTVGPPPVPRGPLSPTTRGADGVPPTRVPSSRGPGGCSGPEAGEDWSFCGAPPVGRSARPVAASDPVISPAGRGAPEPGSDCGPPGWGILGRSVGGSAGAGCERWAGTGDSIPEDAAAAGGWAGPADAGAEPPRTSSGRRSPAAGEGGAVTASVVGRGQVGPVGALSSRGLPGLSACRASPCAGRGARALSPAAGRPAWSDPTGPVAASVEAGLAGERAGRVAATSGERAAWSSARKPAGRSSVPCAVPSDRRVRRPAVVPWGTGPPGARSRVPGGVVLLMLFTLPPPGSGAGWREG